MILIDSWPYDLIVSGELKFSSEITNNPTESGGDVTDHIKRNPIMFTLESVVSDTPIGEVAQHESRRIDDVTVAVFGSDQIPLPSDEAYQRLVAMWTEKRAVTIEIPVQSRTDKPGKRMFLNMAIEDLSIPFSKDSDGGLTFSVSFKQITSVTNKRVSVRTSVPRGQGRARARATVGTAYRVDAQVMWRMGIPNGGEPLLPAHPWALIDVTWSDGKGGPTAKGTYRFSGEQSDESRISIPARYGAVTGAILNSSAMTGYIADGGRELADRQKAKIAAARAAAEETDREFPGGNKNLPESLDLSRFERPSGNDPTIRPNDLRGLR